MNNGFITLHRKLLEWEWYSDANCSRLFIHCLLKANHADKKYQGLLIKRGSFKTGRIRLAEETGLSQQMIRTAIKKLKSTNELTMSAMGKFSIISITNYDKYQCINHNNNQKATTKQPRSNQKATTNNNDNNDNNDNNIYYPNCFAEFWNLYIPVKTERGFTPKGSKKDAEKKYIKILKSGVKHETIITGLEKYLKQCQANRTLTKAVSTWLNQCCWEDDYSNTFIVGKTTRRGSNNAIRLHQELQNYNQ